MEYRLRAIDQELDELLPLAAAIALDGPKGVGKTGTALRRASQAWYLDDRDQRALVEADPYLTSAPDGTLLLDEWQHLPQVWDMVRRSVDAGAPPGRFLLTGSATPKPGSTTHTGAGRILSLRMRPMALFERGILEPTVSMRQLLADTQGTIVGNSHLTLSDYTREITRSGLPGFMDQAGRLRDAQLDAYLKRIIDRELSDQGFTVRRSETLRRWLTAYAAASSTTASYSRILDMTTAGDGTQPAKTTTITYRDFLTQLWLLDPVPGWSHSRSQFTKLQQAPKHQLADPALAARLLNLSGRSLTTARGAAMTGPLFESLATLSVRVAAQVHGARVGHLRTNRGDHEIDLIVEGTDGQVVGFEVKLATSVDDADVRHLLWLRDQLPDDVVDLVVLTTGSVAYRRPDGVAVVPLALLGA